MTRTADIVQGTNGRMVMGEARVSAQTKAHITALRELISPGLYAARLESSLLIELPVVLSRAGRNAPASVRAQVFIAALEEIAGIRLQGSDRVAAKILFAMGDWAGRPVQERHHAVAKLRNRHWTWERNYRKDPLSRDLMTVLLALYRLADSDEHPAESTAARESPIPLAPVSQRLLRRIGRRRTAYPLDMSLEELHAAGLFVEAEMVRYHEQGRHHEPRSINDLIRTLQAGKSILLLGEPGAGKSLTLYETARRSLDHGLLPFPVRARDHRELLADGLADELSTSASSALFVDGLDEAIEPVAGQPSLAETMRDLFSIRPGLFTSRLRDYEDRLSIMLQDLEFDEVCLLRPWTVDREFRDYLQRLTTAELIDEPQLYATVVASERLSELVSRPLYARMLTFVGEHSASNISQPASLYGEYLSKLAGVADAATPSERGALSIWRSAAWAIHTSGHQSGDMISLSELHQAVGGLGQASSVHRLLDQIIDTRSVQGRLLGEFLHYSLYENLVAGQVGDLLVGHADNRILAETLSQDLSREIRHHLTGHLLLSPPRDLKRTLLEVYETAKQMSELENRRQLIACNLLVYLLSRLVGDSEETLTDLLADENESFLRESILWALCHRGSAPALGRFFAGMEEDPRWRSECRGYVLYYYGDLHKEDGPPYCDDPPFRSCSNSYRRIFTMFKRSNWAEKVPAERRAIDLYTFLDLLLVRRSTVADDDIAVLDHLVESLRSDGVAATIVTRLQGMIASLEWTE